jgi:molybdopterin synthase sulfur carrier subunit
MRVQIFATLRQVVGAKEIEVDVASGDTLRTVLQKLAARHPALGEKLLDAEGNLRSSIHVLINGRSVRYLDGLDSSIREDDRLSLFPAVGGG